MSYQWDILVANRAILILYKQHKNSNLHIAVCILATESRLIDYPITIGSLMKYFRTRINK